MSVCLQDGSLRVVSEVPNVVGFSVSVLVGVVAAEYPCVTVGGDDVCVWVAVIGVWVDAAVYVR